MKSFLIKILVFACVFLVIVSIYILFINYSLNHHNYFKINSSTENVILGNSHPECALNDSLIPSFQNFAQGGEAYFYTLIKLKKISENNPQVKTVFVEFGNNDIKKEMDQWVWGTKYINARYPMYSAFMNMSEQSFLALKNPTAIATILPVMIKSNFLFLSGRKKDYLKQFNWGGYFFLNRFVNDSSIHKYRLDSTNDIVISYLNIFYLKKIVEECKTLRLQLYFIRCPIHTSSPNRGSEVQFEKIRLTEFGNIEFLDFQNFHVSNEEFGDIEHLNYKGAKAFSLFFDDLISDSLLLKNKKQAFVNKRIEMHNNL